jgi:hypothetical protein
MAKRNETPTSPGSSRPPQGKGERARKRRFPTHTVHRFDDSTEMLRRAQGRLARFGARFQARSWRDVNDALHTVVTSPALHHLDGPQSKYCSAIFVLYLCPAALSACRRIHCAGSLPRMCETERCGSRRWKRSRDPAGASERRQS